VGKPKYCAHCGGYLDATPSAPVLGAITKLELRVQALETQLRTIEMQDPRIGAEGWHDTIRRIVRDVLRQEGR
jgi:hypothetical protein